MKKILLPVDGSIGSDRAVEYVIGLAREGAELDVHRVRVEVSVPGQQLVVTRGADEHHAYSDVHVAIRDAFEAMRRQLDDYAAVLRRNIKAHAGEAGETA